MHGPASVCKVPPRRPFPRAGSPDSFVLSKAAAFDRTVSAASISRASTLWCSNFASVQDIPREEEGTSVRDNVKYGKGQCHCGQTFMTRFLLGCSWQWVACG